ncbi:hypothetical protein BC628DRAFT_624204 [Trametes gibbosa]|nr:hypothetical protein BC628DRAFT_624204 [Trametes gibbosa]
MAGLLLSQARRSLHTTCPSPPNHHSGAHRSPPPTMQSVVIPPNDTIVVCLGGNDDTRNRLPRVVQITCKTERPDDIGALETYYLAQRELTVCAGQTCPYIPRAD